MVFPINLESIKVLTVFLFSKLISRILIVWGWGSWGFGIWLELYQLCVVKQLSYSEALIGCWWLRTLGNSIGNEVMWQSHVLYCCVLNTEMARITDGWQKAGFLCPYGYLTLSLLSITIAVVICVFHNIKNLLKITDLWIKSGSAVTHMEHIIFDMQFDRQNLSKH